MADTRIGGQTPTLHSSNTTIANETGLEASPPPIGDKQPSPNGQEATKSTLAQKMQGTENKGQHNLSGQLIRHNLNQALPTNATTRTQAGGSPQPAIRDLQESLNKWRTENGQASIKEDGIDGPDTRNAVREFQKQNGIKEDGIAGAETRKKLSTQVDIIALKKDPNTAADMRRLLGSDRFTSLPSDMQSDVISRIKKYADAGELANIGNLVQVIDQNGFGNLPLSGKKLMLDAMAARPDDMLLASSLVKIGNTSFGMLDERSQNWVLKRIQSYGGDNAKIEGLVTIADQTTAPPLTQPQFPHKNDLLTRLMNFPPDSDQVENMVQLVQTRGFKDLPVDVRNQIVDGLPFRFGTGQLTAVGAENMMTLATSPQFEKLHPDKRDEMMNTLSIRSENTELAKALRELAEDRRFQIDKRTWRKTLERVDADIR